MADRIKVLHVVPNMAIGGINRFVLDIARYQKEHPLVEIGIYVCSQNTPPQWMDVCNALNISVFWDNLNAFDLNPFHYRKFLKVRKEWDVVHWHWYSPILTLFTFFDDKVSVFTHHSVLGTGRKSKWSDKLKWRLFRFFVNHRVDCEVYNSEFTRTFWRGFGVHARRNALIYNGARFDTDVSTLHNPMPELEGKFVIGTINNLIGLKRIDLLIEAFGRWAIDKDDSVLVIVGDGPERARLHAAAEVSGVKEKIIFTGHQSDVSPYRRCMNLCVFPSTTETFGLAALECLHAGTPVVVMSDGGGICEVVGDGRNIVESVDGMISRFDYYYGLDESAMNDESKKSYERSLMFDMRDKAVEYVQLYLKLLRG